MTRRPPTTAVLALRAAGSLAIITTYAVLRLPVLTSPWEAAATWVGAVVLGGLALRSIEELAVRHRDRLAPDEPSVLELTDRIEPVRVWPSDMALAIAELNDAMVPMIDRGEVVEPQLFTHEFQPLTPPSGMPVQAPETEYVGRHRPEHIDRDRFGSLFGSF